MKREYINPEIEIVKFTVKSDVFTISDGGIEGGNTGGSLPGINLTNEF